MKQGYEPHLIGDVSKPFDFTKLIHTHSYREYVDIPWIGKPQSFREFGAMLLCGMLIFHLGCPKSTDPPSGKLLPQNPGKVWGPVFQHSSVGLI